MTERDFFETIEKGNQMYSRQDLIQMGFAFQGNFPGIREVSLDIAGDSRIIEVTAIVERFSPSGAVTYLYPVNKIHRDAMEIAEATWKKVETNRWRSQ